MLRSLLLIALCSLQFIAFGQSRTLGAVKTDHTPKIDGHLDDAVWSAAPIATDFIQNFPSFGKPASVRTAVRILYDDNAVYIGAYLYDDPSLVRRQLTSRDGEQRQDVDYFSVFFDTYHDQQNGFQFLVTSANVQSDARIGGGGGSDEGEFGDKTWDAVWASQVQQVADGWTVEMRIPYISLRFSKKDIQDWGMQFLRFTRRNNESSYWNPVDPKVDGFVNQFGQYTGIRSIKPPLRLSFSPYLSGGVRVNPAGSTDGTQWLRNGGMDVKYGINESFTLDATLIPDFGQVVSDNVVNNLSPFEVYFQDNRPFFTEGTELFNKSNLFYSRRIGATPAGYYGVQSFLESHKDYSLIKNPSVTQLYNGIKFSGRTKKKLGIGIFNAVTAPAEARLINNVSHKDTVIQTEPLTNYNIIVLDQALAGRSSITFTNTNVLRNGTARDANVSALDWSLFTKGNNYQLQGTARYSHIFSGSPYDGFNTSLRAGKVSGKWQYTAAAAIKSQNYNPRDLGFLLTPNESIYRADVSYNQFTPTKNFLNFNYSFNTTYRRLYKPNVFNDMDISVSGFWLLKNFWDVNLSVGYIPDQHDYFLLGYPYNKFARRPAFGYVTLEGSTDSRKKLFFGYEYQLTTFPGATNKHYHVADMSLRYRFSNKFNLELSYRHEAETDYIVYAGEETNGDPIIGFVNFKDVTSVLSGRYSFTPRIYLTVRARHYWSHVPYNRFANVDDDGNAVARNPLLPAPDVNSNINIFNLDAFFTWDFRLGSRITLGYKNWLGDHYLVDGDLHRSYSNNIARSFNTGHGNELTMKLIYFLDYNQLKGRK